MRIFCVISFIKYEKVQPAGYQKAMERGNSIPRPKGFCEADKVKFSAVLSQNIKCRDLCIINILMFYENIVFYWSFWQVVKL